MPKTFQEGEMAKSQAQGASKLPIVDVATKEINLTNGEEEIPPQDVDPTKTPLWEVDNRFFNPNAQVQEVQTFVTMAERKALPLQGIVSFSAKPKQGKSSAIRALLMPIITGMPFDSVEPTQHKPRLCIVFDTEMDAATLQERTLSMREVLGEDANRYQVVSLLEIPKAQRIDIIEDITERYDPDIVVIDQVAMLVSDFNNSQESNEIRDKLLAFSSKRAVWCVIHQNKAQDNTQMKGHLGSMLDEMATENYSVKRENGVFEVKPVNARRTYIDKHTQGFTFSMDDNGKIVSAADTIYRNKEKEREQLAQDLMPIFEGSEVLAREDIVKRIIGMEHIKRSAANDRVTKAISAKALIKVDTKHRSPYRLNK